MQIDDYSHDAFGRHFRVEKGVLFASRKGDTNDWDLSQSDQDCAFAMTLQTGAPIVRVQSVFDVLVIEATDGIYVLANDPLRVTKI